MHTSSQTTPAKSAKCLYCGAHPVPHTLTFLSESLSILFASFDRLLAENATFRKIGDAVDWLCEKVLLRLLLLCGIARYNDDASSISAPRPRVLWEEAKQRGIPMRSIRVFGKDIDLYEAHVGRGTITFTGLPRPNARGAGVWWMDDKEALRNRLLEHGIPAPRGGSFTTWKSIERAFEEFPKPVVVKPRLGSRGRHTTTFVRTRDDLRRAFRTARELCFWVVAEEQLLGDVYRATVINGKVVGILGGSPPRVTGDGMSSVAKLVAVKNDTKPKGVSDVVISPLTVDFLRRIGYAPESVLQEGVTIGLTEKIGVSYGGTSYDVTDEAHPELTRIFEKAAAVVGDPILGFDFIIPDVRSSPRGQRWGIIECNSLPFINLHHNPLVGASRNVAQYVWDLWQPSRTLPAAQGPTAEVCPSRT